MKIKLSHILSFGYLLISFNMVGAQTKTDAKKEVEHWITIGADSLPGLQERFGNLMKRMDVRDGIAVMKLRDADRNALSDHMHEAHHRCGGYIVHESYEDAKQTLNGVRKRRWIRQHQFLDYSIDQDEMVEPMLEDVDEVKIAEVISHLSSYHNRYYKSQSGIESSKWIGEKWFSLSNGRSDVTLELINHPNFPQQSVILTIQGSSETDEIIVIGGHADSIAGYWGGSKNHAPGADDNASGIATMTEIIRVAMAHNYKPYKTVQFMAYAAEEVGLVGSNLIAKKYKQENKQVVGVIQLDMTNYKGSDEYDIVMMDDYTNSAQNQFLGQLIDHYVKVPWGYSRCGYACSDHASWSKNGYPASMPHEATMKDGNPHIHTKRDTIDKSNDSGEHASNFAKLGLAYMVELAKQ